MRITFDQGKLHYTEHILACSRTHAICIIVNLSGYGILDLNLVAMISRKYNDDIDV